MKQTQCFGTSWRTDHLVDKKKAGSSSVNSKFSKTDKRL